MIKKCTHLFIILLLISSCNDIQISDRLNKVDSLVVKEQYDSAAVLIKEIAECTMSTENQAHYFLLKTQLGYITNHPLPSDSLLDQAINYYRENGNQSKLADAYYYKSCSHRLSGDYHEAILVCKEAEHLAMGTNDMRLRFKIAENLSYLNGLCENHLLQLHYAKEALSFAKTVQRKDWMAYSYNKVCFAFHNLGQQDSAYTYIKQSIPYLEYVCNADKVGYLTNIGLLYKETDPRKAKEYLEKALSYGKHPGTLEHLADIYYDEGNKKEAYLLWKKALTTSGRYEKDNLIYNILIYDLEHGHLEEASSYLDKIISIKDSMLYLLRNDTVKDLQLRFDHEVALHEADTKLISTQRVIFCLLFVLGGLVVLIIIKKNRAEALEKEHQMQLYAYTTEINQLKANFEEAQNAEKTIEELNYNIRKLLDDESPKLKQGRMLYDHIMEGGTTSRWKSKEERLFNNYYAAVNYQVYNRLRKVKRVSKLSPHNLFYLILKEIGKTDKEIMRIMALSPEGLRSLRSRTKPMLTT
jgi:DNA-binding CsgD family transcriptional regulator